MKSIRTTYRKLGVGYVQSDAPLTDMDSVIIYEGEDGTVWVRREAEFLDGRFGEIPNVTQEADEMARDFKTS